MSGKLLQFKPQDDYDASLSASSPDSELTGLELFQKLYDFNQEHLLRIIKAHKSTGGWNPTAETIAARLRENFKSLAANVAGARDAKTKKESPKSVGNQPIIAFVPIAGLNSVPVRGDDDRGPVAG